jgi:hypothetical protein
MTDRDQAARIAAMRARRGQAPVAIPSRPASSPAWAPPSGAPVTGLGRTRPAIEPATNTLINPRPNRAPERPRGKHPHVAAGARIIATGLTASGIFGLTSIIAAANRPVVSSSGPAPSTPPTTTTLDPALVATTAASTSSTVLLTLPPTTTLPTAAPVAPTAAAPAPTPAKPVAAKPAAPKPATTVAPAPAPAPAPKPTPAPTPTPAPVVTQPPAPVTTTKTSKA